MSIKPIPVNYFGMALGLLGTSLALRQAASMGLVPASYGQALEAFSVLVWALLCVLYAYKWMAFRDQAKAEVAHPIMCCFLSLVPITTMLVGAVTLPYSRAAAITLIVIGTVGQIVFSVIRGAGLWQGKQTIDDTTPVVYLPTVAGNFVSAIGLGALGYTDIGLLFFGAGVFSWLGLEAAVVGRLRTGKELPAPLRPVLGIQLAPAFVGSVAYLSVNGGQVDMLVMAMVGYGVLQLLFLARLGLWITQKNFSMGLWAFSFGIASMINVGARLAHGVYSPAMVYLGTGLFYLGLALIAALLLGTLRFFLKK